MQSTEKPIYAFTIKGFCRAYGIGHTKAYGEIGAGRLIARKVGRRTLILKTDADAWLAALPAARTGDRQSERSD